MSNWLATTETATTTTVQEPNAKCQLINSIHSIFAYQSFCTLCFVFYRIRIVFHKFSSLSTACAHLIFIQFKMSINDFGFSVFWFYLFNLLFTIYDWRNIQHFIDSTWTWLVKRVYEALGMKELISCHSRDSIDFTSLRIMNKWKSTTTAKRNG